MFQMNSFYSCGRSPILNLTRRLISYAWNLGMTDLSEEHYSLPQKNGAQFNPMSSSKRPQIREHFVLDAEKLVRDQGTKRAAEYLIRRRKEKLSLEHGLD